MFGEDKATDKKSVEKLDAIKNEYKDEVQRYVDAVALLKKTLSDVSGALMQALDAFESFGSPWDYSSVGTIGCLDITVAKRKLNGIFDFIENMESRKNDIVRRIIQLRSSYYEKNLKAAKGQEEIVDDIVNSLGSEVFDFKLLGLFDYDEAQLSQDLILYRDVRSKIKELETIEKEKIRTQAILAYRDEHCLEIAKGIDMGTISPVPEEVKIEIHRFLSTIEQEEETLRECSLKQQELFEKYDKVYYSLIRRVDQ